MVYIAKNSGEFDPSSLSAVMSNVRKPVFVDNAVHYGEVVSQLDSKSKVNISQTNDVEYKLATEKTYSFSESESSLLLTHKETPGHSNKSTIWSPEGKNKMSKLLYLSGEEENRLLGGSTESTSSGVRMELRNMKSRNLKSLGVENDSVHLGQVLDVGFRSTDLVNRLAADIDGNLTSVSIGNPLSVSNSGGGRRKHSNIFVAHDFNRMNLLSAIRLVSRHDNRILLLDNFSNLLYVPLNHIGGSKFLDSRFRQGDEERNPTDSAENRISVQGIPMALNEDVIVVVDDASRQQGKYDSDVIEKINPILDVTVRDKQTARKIARQILKGNSLRSGAIKTAGHPEAWYLRPGDIVEYRGEKMMVIDATHRKAKGLSDFVFYSLDAGLVGILQRLSEGTSYSSAIDAPEIGIQIEDLNFSFFNEMEISIIPLISTTGVSTNGVLIGQHAGRLSIGGNAEKIGLNKSLTKTIKGEM